MTWHGVLLSTSVPGTPHQPLLHRCLTAATAAAAAAAAGWYHWLVGLTDWHVVYGGSFYPEEQPWLRQ
jgi:hypothetical protein